MRLSRLTDYGILLLTAMAREPDRTHTARDLAEATQVPLPTVSKVLKTLTKGGVLVSHRGVVGGYGLARGPDRISLVDVVGALEGPIAITQCSEGPGHCSLENGCSSAPHLQVVNQAIIGALAKIRLTDLVQPRFVVLGGRTNL